MSCRQPSETSPSSTSAPSDAPEALVRNGRNLPWAERFEEPARPFQIELRVARFDAQEEAVAARQREPRYVEHRVIGLREAVEREHSENRRQRGHEDRAFEGDGDERGPAV